MYTHLKCMEISFIFTQNAAINWVTSPIHTSACMYVSAL